MITLSQLNCAYGAPMGRREVHRVTTKTLALHLERVPLIDGGYDCGGAYWGAPADLWHYRSRQEDDENEVYGFVRGGDRELAMASVHGILWQHTLSFLPEAGSIIEQTIEHLASWVSANAEDAAWAEQVNAAQNEIDQLQLELELIRDDK